MTKPRDPSKILKIPYAISEVEKALAFMFNLIEERRQFAVENDGRFINISYPQHSAAPMTDQPTLA